MNAVKQFVIFALGDEVYGIDISLIESIERMTAITRIPYAAIYVPGVINLRGEIVPVVNLRQRFGLENKEPDKLTRIVVTSFKDYKVGMIVDRVLEIVEVSDESLQSGEDILLEGENRQFIDKIIEREKKFIMILNLEKVLNIPSEI